MQSLKSRLELAEGRLAAVGPRATLLRGYAIARSRKGLILQAQDARPGRCDGADPGPGKAADAGCWNAWMMKRLHYEEE